jgi:hypothetical protein
MSMENDKKKGFYFKQYEANQSPFDKLFVIFKN